MSWFRRQPPDPARHWPYTPDERDRVVPLADVPQSDVGAPLPVVLASDYRLLLIYLLQDTPADWDGTWVRVVSPDSEDMPVAVVEFQRPYAHLFGPPNDEAIAGHPLSGRGLAPCDAYTVEDSSWIRALERMNSVHPNHRPGMFWKLTHYVFTFHDSTFECVAGGFTVSLHRGSLRDIVASVVSRVT
ncbi:MAG TPA: hypothetical protein VF006_05095 [Longimicrobium sp.]